MHPLENPAYTLENPPSFPNHMVVVENTSDWVARKWSIPILWSICKKWTIGEPVSRSMIAELPCLSRFALITKLEYARTVISWAIKARAKHLKAGFQLDFGIERDPLNKKYYRRSGATWLMTYIMKEEEGQQPTAEAIEETTSTGLGLETTGETDGNS